MERFFLGVCKCLLNPGVIIILLVLSLSICAILEFGFVFIVCESRTFVKVGNQLLLNISYGVLVSSLFHLLVNVCPNTYKEHMLRPFVKSTMLDIREQLRQALELPKNPFELKDIPTEKGEGYVSVQKDKCEECGNYMQIFNDCDFLKPYPFNNSIKLIDKFNEIRTEIRKSADDLLRYRDLLSTDEFDFAAVLKKSVLLTIGLRARTEISDDEFVNQKEIGECVFCLYEQSKRLT